VPDDCEKPQEAARRRAATFGRSPSHSSRQRDAKPRRRLPLVAVRPMQPCVDVQQLSAGAKRKDGIGGKDDSCDLAASSGRDRLHKSHLELVELHPISSGCRGTAVSCSHHSH
jgi:hypothetical protein